jgi:erythromycin esterase-like protein
MLSRVLLDDVRELLEPLTDGEAGDYDALLRLLGDARLALLGTASYGSHELFRARAEVTKRLIQDVGFTAVAVGAEAQGVQRVDDFVRGKGADALASASLGDFTRFPAWLWRNAEMLDFVGWLRNYNDQFPRDVHKVGIYGLDALPVDGADALVWNARERQLADDVDALMLRLNKMGRPARTVVWEHSRRVGDARATDSDASSLGQFARERHGRSVVLVSFSTYTGSIVAATDQAPERKQLLPALGESYETLCHAVEVPRFYLPLRGTPARFLHGLRETRPQRTLGLLNTEEYVQARLADQFDAVVYFDETRNIEPL